MSSYSRGQGYKNLECCGTDCSCEPCNGLWYIKCANGYSSVDDCSVCTKDKQKDKQKSFSYNWIYILVILIIILILIYNANFFGYPESTDSYTKLEEISTGRQAVYYV